MTRSKTRRKPFGREAKTLNWVRRSIAVPRWLAISALGWALWRLSVWLYPMVVNVTPPLLMSGIVIDEAGAPIGGADLQLFVARRLTTAAARARADSSGRFDLRADDWSGRVDVIVSHPDYVTIDYSDTSTIPTAHVFRLERAARVVGELAGAPGSDGKGTRCVYWADADDPKCELPGRRGVRSIGEDGAFSLSGMRAGNYILEFGDCATSTPRPRRVGPIALHAGQTTDLGVIQP